MYDDSKKNEIIEQIACFKKKRNERSIRIDGRKKKRKKNNNNFEEEKIRKRIAVNRGSREKEKGEIKGFSVAQTRDRTKKI